MTETKIESERKDVSVTPLLGSLANKSKAPEVSASFTATPAPAQLGIKPPA